MIVHKAAIQCASGNYFCIKTRTLNTHVKQNLGECVKSHFNVGMKPTWKLTCPTEQVVYPICVVITTWKIFHIKCITMWFLFSTWGVSQPYVFKCSHVGFDVSMSIPQDTFGV